MKSLTFGVVKKITPIGQKNKTLVRKMDGEKIVFNVHSYHPSFRYNMDYGCKPEKRDDCMSCPYRFECYTIGKAESGEGLIKIEFNGDTIGIFPTYWRYPRPTENELEAFLWGESNGRLQLRSYRSARQRP